MSQIVPDSTLPTPSQAAPGCTDCVINGGTSRGTNLFHSFGEFSIPSGGQARFNNELSIQNIFARITGNQPSRIDGILKANGSANLFLINPNGIVFGANAQLDLGGSFLATTANTVQFDDRTQFSTDSATPPIFTNRSPIGLNFTNPGAIEVNGSGHTQFVNSLDNSFAGRIAFTRQGQTAAGLRVQPNQTIALIGGEVTLKGGQLTAPAGQVEIGSVKSGTVGLSSNLAGFRLNFAEVQQFGEISLVQQSAIDATGDRFSRIHLRGSTITLNDASLLLIENTGSGGVGEIELKADRQINLIGVTSFNRQDQLPLTQKINRSIISLTDSGPGANIFLSSPNIQLTDSAYVSTITFGSGKAGNIQVQANRLNVQGIAETEAAGIASNLTTSTYGSGWGGNIDITANQVELAKSGLVYTTTYNFGQAGDLSLKAQTLWLDGGTPGIAFSLNPLPNAALTFIPTNLGSSSVSSANSGNVSTQIQHLRVTNGAQLGTTSLVTGQAGTVTITATDSVLVEGTIRLSRSEADQLLTPAARQGLLRFGIDPSQIGIDRSVPSIIGSGGGLRNLFTERVANLASISTSQAGSITINSPRIQVNDARITVQNAGIGDAGTLTINANQLQLNRGGSIAASTFSGNGGNIALNVNQISLQNSSEITTNAGAGGNGGSIDLSSGVLATLSGSQISANADRGRGGNVRIAAQGVFTDRSSAISATSERGPEFNGTVQINALEPEIERSAIRSVPTPEVPKIASICPAQADPNASSLMNNGTGGIPNNPSAPLSSRQGWMPSIANQRAAIAATVNQPSQTEIQGWMLNPDRKTVRLTVAGRGSPQANAAQPCLPQF